MAKREVKLAYARGVTRSAELMPHNLSRERYLPEPLKIRTDWWFNPSIAHQSLAGQILYLGRLRIRRGKYVENATIPVPLPVTA